MEYKEFFKPTIGKIILFLIIFIFFTYLPTGFLKVPPISSITSQHQFGFPFIFLDSQNQYCAEPLIYGIPHVDEENCPLKFKFNIFNLILDFLFVYLISCLLFFIFNKLISKVIK